MPSSILYLSILSKCRTISVIFCRKFNVSRGRNAEEDLVDVTFCRNESINVFRHHQKLELMQQIHLKLLYSNVFVIKMYENRQVKSVDLRCIAIFTCASGCLFLMNALAFSTFYLRRKVFNHANNGLKN